MPGKKDFEYLLDADLKNHIKSGCFAPCYVLFGDEHYMLKKHLEDIVSRAVDEFEEFNISRFEGNANLRSICDAATAFPMMCAKRVVTVADFPIDKASSSDLETIFELIGELPSTTVLIFWFETVEIDPKKPHEKAVKLFEAIKRAGGHIVNVSRKGQAELVNLLQRGAAKRKCRLEASVARYIYETCSDDLSTLINELEKLCLFVGDDGVISKDVVDKVCSRSVEASVYNLSKMLLRGDLQGAYKALDDLLYMNTEPALLINILSSSYIDIYRAFAARKKGVNPESVGKDLGYFKNAFRLSEADRNLRNFSEKQLVLSLGILAECDRKVKGSRGDSRAILESAMAELTVVLRQGKQ